MTHSLATLRAALPLAALVTSLALTACGGGGDDDSSDPAAVDVAGTWKVTEVITSNCPGEAHLTRSYRAVVTQDGTALSVKTPAGTFAGEIHGYTVGWSGSYAEDGGTTSISDMKLTANAGGSAFEGSSRFSYAGGSGSCAGSTQSSGTRL